jgi:hypothetical protein
MRKHFWVTAARAWEVGMTELTIARLMQNPLGQVAPAGHRGDMVRVSDGVSVLYLLPAEFDALSDDMLRTALLLAAHRIVAETETGAPTVPSRMAQGSQGRPARVPRTPAAVAATRPG